MAKKGKKTVADEVEAGMAAEAAAAEAVKNGETFEDPTCGRLLGSDGGECGLREGHDGKCAPAAPLDRKVHEVEMELPVVLNQAEREAAVKQLVEAFDQMAAHVIRATEAKAKLKAEETEIDAVINAKVKVLREGTELRGVKVAQVYDLPTNAYWEIRHDTGEEIPGSRRALEIDERQSEFDLRLPADEAKKNDVSLPKTNVEVLAETTQKLIESGAVEATPKDIVDAAINSELTR